MNRSNAAVICPQFRAGPLDDFKKRSVLGIEVAPMDDAFVVEDAVAQVADAFPARVQFAEVAF